MAISAKFPVSFQEIMAPGPCCDFLAHSLLTTQNQGLPLPLVKLLCSSLLPESFHLGHIQGCPLGLRLSLSHLASSSVKVLSLHVHLRTLSPSPELLVSQYNNLYWLSSLTMTKLWPNFSEAKEWLFWWMPLNLELGRYRWPCANSDSYWDVSDQIRPEKWHFTA